MTEREKAIFDEYGTAYPCCGNCIHIREAGYKLMCRKYLEYRDYTSVKCTEYSHQQHINKLEELSYLENRNQIKFEPFDMVIYKPTGEEGLVKCVTDSGVFVVFRIQSTAQLCKPEDLEKE